MTDDASSEPTPEPAATPESPASEANPPASEPATAGTDAPGPPPADDSGAEPPSAPESSGAAAGEPTTGESPTVADLGEAPTTATEPTGTHPVPVEAATAGATSKRSSTVAVPKWLVGALALLIAVGAGFGIGRWTDSDDSVEDASTTQTLPGFSNGNGNGNNAVPAPSTRSTAFLGVSAETASNGARVTTVANGTPADDAGLRVGDVITKVDGDSVTSLRSLAAAVGTHDPGDEVKVTYVRDGDEHTVDVVLGNRSDIQQNG